MRKLHKRFTLDQYGQDRKLPLLNQSEFSAKLNDLLDRVSVQNRYASRISHCNMKNLQELEQAKNELKRIAQEKKMQQLKSNDTKDLIDQMSHRVKDSESQLEKLFKEVTNAKKEIRRLKSVIADLQNQNLLLEKQVLKVKRQKWEQICSTKQEVDQELLQSQIGQYLVSSLQTSTILYTYCLNVHKTNSYSNFFEELDRKIEKELKNKERMTAIQSLEKRFHSNLKLNIRKNLNKDENSLRRHRTEHNHAPRSLEGLDDSIG